MTGYELSRAWFNFCFENPEKVKPSHTAIYFFAVDHCNRLGWKEKFGLPTTVAMECVGIKNYKTYIKSLQDIADWEFINWVERSKNQYSSNIIALVNSTKPNLKADIKALDKAFLMQNQSIDSIDKPLNNKQFNNKQLSEIEISEVPEDLKIYFQIAIKFQKVFIQNLLEKQAPAKIQERAKFGNYVLPIRLMMEKDGVTSIQFDRALKLLKSPDGEFWKKNILSTQKLREKISQLLSIEQTKLTVNNSTMNLSVSEKLKSYE